MKEKESIRKAVWQRLYHEGISIDPFNRIPPFKGQNKAAERLRRLQIYKKAKRIMVPPDEAQKQVRINILADNKILIMATPGLRDGFYELNPRNIPIDKWAKAVTTYGVTRWGKRLFTSYKDIGQIDLLITGAVAVAKDGVRIGKGAGFFDLEYAILRTIDSINEKTPIIALVNDTQIFDNLPRKEKDVAVDFIVTPTQVIDTKTSIPRPKGIDWLHLDSKAIKRMRPLKELFKSVVLGGPFKNGY